MTRYASDIPATQLFSADDLPLSKVLPTEGIDDLLDRLYFRSVEEAYDPATETTTLQYGAVVDPEAAFELPGLGGMQVVVGGDTAMLAAEFVGGPDTGALTLSGGIALRFPREWLRPVVETEDGWVDDPSREHVELGFGGGVTVDHEFDVTFEGSNRFTVEPAMIGDTGLVVEGSVAVDLSETTAHPSSAAMGLDPSWRGVVFDDLTLHLPEALDVPGAPAELSLEEFHVGGGGVSGTVSGDWDAGDATGSLFGMEFELRTVDIEFRESALVGAGARGTLTLPFFDGPVDLELGIAGDGTVTAALDDPDGLVSVDHDAYALEIDGLRFSTAGTPAVALSGTVTPKLVPDAPGVRIEELSVDADGNVRVEGGWLDLPDQYSIDFYGTTFEITAFGLGRNDDGSKWVGLDGSVTFVDELSAGASVDGLRVTWFDDGPRAGDAPQLSFEGIGVELEIPDAVRFKGAVSYTERTLDDGSTDHRFEGDIGLDLLALDVSVDGKLVVGQREEAGETFTYLAVYLGVDLPTGIPLFSTGLSLYGFAGLYAQNMSPALEDDEAWFTRDPDQESWYHRDPEGATGFGGDPPKWPARKGDLAFGAGVTLGTAADDGFSFSGNLLLVVAFPGPVVVLNGEATMLAKRSDLDSGEPNFSALAVLDGRAGTFTFGLDAQYRFGDGGELVDIGASVEAFYSLNDPTAWYVYIGRKEPREKRVRATIFSLFEANGYVMLDSRQLAVGAWYGFDESYSFGPLGVDLEAWLSGDAVLSFDPAHFSGVVAARGAVRLRAFGFTAGISLDATIAAEVFDPFHLLGKVRVALELPGFLPDPSATVTLEWGPRPEPPELSDPLAGVAIDHDLGTATWPLALDDDTPPADEDLPVVPLDGRPQLTFAAAVHDDGYDALATPDGTPDPVGENAHPVRPAYVRIGDPAANEGPVEVRYGLAAVRVERRTASGWESMPDVFGSWAPVPTLPEGDRTEGADPPMANTKLSLFTPNPFAYVRHTSGAWGDAMVERAGDYPCLAKRDCWTFEGTSLADFDVRATTLQGIPVTTVDRADSEPWPTFHHAATVPSDPPDVEDVFADGARRALTLGFVAPADTAGDDLGQYLVVDLPEPRKSVAIEVLADKYCDAIGLFGTDSEGESVTTFVERPEGTQRLTVTSREGTLDRVVLVAYYAGDTTATSSVGDLAVFSVCASTAALSDVGALEVARERTIREQVARLGDEAAVFDSHTTYRIAVETTLQARGLGEFDWFTEERTSTAYAYFRTDGPPTLASLSVPEGADPEQFESGLEDLRRYVRGTVPETLPARGERPSLPRPVYRAYDVGVRFNRTHVDRLYRSVGRDLALVLFDRNNRPARTADGRLHVVANRWGEQADLLLDVAERQWLRAVDRGECAGIDRAVVTRDDLLDAVVGLGVLDADEVYEARLLPRLLRDPFGDRAYYDGEPPWTAVTRGGASADWTVDGHPDLAGARAEPAGDGFRLQIRDPNAADGAPPSYVDADLSALTAGADVIRFAAAAGSKTVRITAVDPASATVEVDGSPSFTTSRWLVPGRGEVTQAAATPTGDDAFTCWVRDPVPGTPAPETWTDYRAAMTVTLDAPDAAAGLAVRYDADGGHLRYVVDAGADERRLVSDDGSTATVLETVPGPVDRGQPYALAIEAVDEELRVYEDDTLVATATADDALAGGVALVAHGPATFGELRVDDVSTDAPVAYRFAFTTSRFANVAHHLGSYADETWRATSADPIDATEGVALGDADTPPTADEGRAYAAAVDALDRPASDPPTRVEATVVGESDTPHALLLESPEPLDWTRTTLSLSHTTRGSAADVVPDGAKVTDVTYGADETVGLLLDRETDLSGHRVEFRHDGDGHVPPLVGALFVDDAADEQFVAYGRPDGVRRTADGAFVVDPDEAPETLFIDERFPAEAVWSVAFDAPGDAEVGLAFREGSDSGYRFTVGPDGRALVHYDVGGFDTLWADDTVVASSGPVALRVEAVDGRLTVYQDEIPVCAVDDPGGSDGRFGPVVNGDSPVTVTHVAVHETAARAGLFAESFDDPALDGWTVVDEPPETTRTSDWRVEDGTLAQHSNIYGFHGEPYGEPGTFLVTDEPFTDGRVTVRLRSDDDDAIGVMVRVRDEENYYRFSMDSERSYRRFDRQTDGITVPLWADEVSFEAGHEYLLTLDCEGDRFTGYLDGVELFSVRDSAHAAGALALYCRANVGAKFHDAHVTAAADQWVTYHRFEDESPRPAGTQLRLHAGPTPDRTGAGIVPVRVGEEPRLPTTGAALRLVGPDGVRHERWVAPASAFGPVTDVTLLRALDGTGVCCLVDGPLENGTYRLDVEYARDGEVRLTQAGDSTPERARLDLTVTD
ncbi:DUF1080 domain-containing protein [Salinirubellus salinus]|uniref:DUF1080 domain-containing protein n=1 Tax=Salinirubellus salinus TaxID=1364945 RepID=A0A9E7U302_9EURY|nr:DUF1080 domain-containing protein [Salinirubellus salinus]UWM52725.1 DUF1080 domain-containing protein [Salinirubellus salinus]